MAITEKWANTGLVGREHGMFVDLDIVAVSWLQTSDIV
jgi:hypothetical protein